MTPGAFAIMESESSTIQSLSREDIESVSQLGEDIYQVVNRLPGVSSSDFSARFTVRGGEHDETNGAARYGGRGRRGNDGGGGDSGRRDGGARGEQCGERSGQGQRGRHR